MADTLRLIATTTTPYSTAYILKNFTDLLTVETFNSCMKEFAQILRAKSISKPPTVTVHSAASPPPPPSPPPLSPPSSPTTSEDKANSQTLTWALSVPLSVLLIAAVVLLVLCYQRQFHLSRDRANFRISRDRLDLDLQMISHQVQRVQTQSDGSASLPDSLPAKRSISLAKAPKASLPPGPPSSSAGQSVAEQELTRSSAVDSGVVPMAPSA